MAVAQVHIDEAKAACPLHVRLAIDEVSEPTDHEHPAFVVGRVTEVLRGPAELVGRVLRVRVEVNLPDAPPRPPSGILWIDWHALSDALELEACLSEAGEGTYAAPCNDLDLHGSRGLPPPPPMVTPAPARAAAAPPSTAPRRPPSHLPRTLLIFVATMAGSALVAWQLTR